MSNTHCSIPETSAHSVADAEKGYGDDQRHDGTRGGWICQGGWQNVAFNCCSDVAGVIGSLGMRLIAAR